jgi:PmbA protein
VRGLTTAAPTLGDCAGHARVSGNRGFAVPGRPDLTLGSRVREDRYPMELRELADDVLRRVRAEGADAADALAVEGSDFRVTVRLGEIEALTDSTSRALGVRAFSGRRVASAHTSDLSAAGLATLARQVVEMARATSEDSAAGLPDETPPAESVDLAIHDASVAEWPTPARIEHARRAEAAALGAFPEITNSQGASLSCGDGAVVLANSQGFVGEYRTSSVSLSVVPVGARDGVMERDYWYSAGRGLGDLDAPEQVGRIAAERTLRRLGARKIATCEVPVIFDPETAADLLGHVFGALSGYAVYRDATFLKGRAGQLVASPLVTVVDDGRRRRGLGSRPFDGEGLGTRVNTPIEQGVLRFFMCDTYAGRKIGAPPVGSARRGVSGGPGVGAGNLSLMPGSASPADMLGEVRRGLLVTDLIGFGVNLVTGDYSQGAAGQWIEDGRIVHPVHEVTIAGNLSDMLRDIDAVGDDLVFRGSVAAPTLRVRRMTVSGG